VNFASIHSLPPWIVMWAFAVAVYAICKLITWASCRCGAPWWKQVGYLLAWPGMDAEGFFGKRAARPVSREWLFATAKCALGVMLVWVGLRWLAEIGVHSYVVGWLGMMSIVVVLHFGLFHLLSCAWRMVGVAAEPIMNWPAAATSLGEFWGRRWNRAFRDLTYRFLFRPLKCRFGPSGALFAGFVVSGIAHDAVISLPAGGGYGLPTAYFVIQAVAMFVERSAAGKVAGLGRGVLGWLFCIFVVLLPSVLLFHRPFIEVVILPFLQAIRAIP
jgi:alginate O-acetyltransferase complex protein AlgI